MPSAACGAHRDFERRMHRTVWIASILFAIGAAIVYAEKAAEDRSAFVRWRHQVLQLMQGVNIYDTVMYPNPPIMPLTLYPLMVLPPVVGALCWFALKVVLTAASASICFEMVRPADQRLPAWVQGTDPAPEPAADPQRPPSRQQQPGDPLPGRRLAAGLAQGLRRARGADPGALRSATRSRRRSSSPTSCTSDRGGRSARPSWGWGSSCSSSRAWCWASSSMANAWRCGGIGS